MFPEDDLLGVDLVIPDYSALARNGRKVWGVALTHAHEDHVGSLPYLLRAVSAPVYGTPLTIGLAKNKSRASAPFHDVQPRQPVSIGPFEVEWIRVGHSIPDACALAIKTPAGMLVFSGDFKFDQTPIDGRPTDLARFAELGEAGVLALFLDSTNVERPGVTPSERVVGESLQKLFPLVRGRILVTTFASNIHRFQQIFDAAARVDRKVAAAGRSIAENLKIASQLGYVSIPPSMLVSVEEANRLPDDRVLLLTTGSQGEPLSALTRISTGAHKQVKLKAGDTVIFSASPIPGNEAMVARTINFLFKHGAEVIYGPHSGGHVSGHASQEELRMMINLVRPRYVVPVHGEARHLVLNGRLARSVGLPGLEALIGENGTIFEFGPASGRIAGKEDAGNVLVDGLGVGDVGDEVLRDRKHLAHDGVFIALVAVAKETGDIVRPPDLVTRGFVYEHGPHTEKLLEGARDVVGAAVDRCRQRERTDFGAIRTEVREALAKFLFEKTGRRPMVLPLLVEV